MTLQSFIHKQRFGQKHPPRCAIPSRYRNTYHKVIQDTNRRTIAGDLQAT